MKKIPLTKNKFTLIDDSDFEWLNQWKWCLSSNGYAVRSTVNIHIPKGKPHRNTEVKMHRLITNSPKDKQVDHINGDKLDNQKANLRICTQQDNIHNQKKRFNKSGFKGVCREKSLSYRSKPWKAYIAVNYRQINLGRFATSSEAAKAYDEAAKKYHGEFARLN